MEGKLDKKNKSNSKLLVVLVSVMSVVMVGVFGVLGVVLYKGYASESDVGNAVTSSVVSTEESVDNFSYYNKVTEYADIYVTYVGKVYNIIKNNNLSESDKTEALKYTNEFILYSQEFVAFPISYEDNLLDDNFFNFKLSAESFADYVKSYLYKDDKVYITFLQNSFDDSQIHLDTIYEIEKKYYK